jgi:hypothetical protein
MLDLAKVIITACIYVKIGTIFFIFNAYLFFSPENIHMDSSLTTSSELVLPSPTKVRMRKSRHRRGSKGSLSSIFSSPAKSPTKDALHEELHAKQLQLQRSDPRDVSPGVFKYLGPGTAVREYKSNDEHEFGCHKCSRDLTIIVLSSVFKFDVMVVKFSVPVSVSKEQFKFSFESFSRRVIFDSLMFSMFWFSIKSFGPGTAVREYKSNDEHEFGCHKCSRDLTHSNLNDVCFGCEGGCRNWTRS